MFPVIKLKVIITGMRLYFTVTIKYFSDYKWWWKTIPYVCWPCVWFLKSLPVLWWGFLVVDEVFEYFQYLDYRFFVRYSVQISYQQLGISWRLFMELNCLYAEEQWVWRECQNSWQDWDFFHTIWRRIQNSLYRDQITWDNLVAAIQV